MMNRDRDEIWNHYRAELESKVTKMTQLQDQLAKLAQEVEGLEQMCMGFEAYSREVTKSSDGTLGISDAIRKVLNSSNEAMRPTEIREELREIEFDIDGYKQPLSAIHTTIRRLKDQGEVETIEVDGEATRYKIIPDDLIF